jgi:hypothetical protein
MTEMHSAADHYACAAIRHERAMRYHLEASRQYQVVNDRAHAEHEALVAHEHALKAIDRGCTSRAIFPRI